MQDPQLIEAKRQARRLKKEQRELEATHLAPGLNEHGFNTAFRKRNFQAVPSTARQASRKVLTSFRLLSYNVLAQSLVRRKLFPTSGEAIKWKNRQTVLQMELQHYDCDILCLQEVGTDMLTPFLDSVLREAGYEYVFHAGKGKQHGVMIVFRKQRFDLISTERINYDDAEHVEANNMTDLPRTNNVGLVCVLCDTSTNTNFIVATTHLFWHPLGTYERARQVAVLVRRACSIGNSCGLPERVILAGDFNTEPTDPSYLALTRRPFSLDERGRQIMLDSVATPLVDEETDEPDGSDNTTPVNFQKSDNWQKRLGVLSNGPQFSSIYGKHYEQIDPENAGQDGEPMCTNYAHKFRGTLDYVFVPGTSEFECSELLIVPKISSLDFSQPHEGEFPSDHFAIGCCLDVLESRSVPAP